MENGIILKEIIYCIIIYTILEVEARIRMEKRMADGKNPIY